MWIILQRDTYLVLIVPNNHSHYVIIKIDYYGQTSYLMYEFYSEIKSVFIFIINHKFASRSFTMCTVYNTLCP